MNTTILFEILIRMSSFTLLLVYYFTISIISMDISHGYILVFEFFGVFLAIVLYCIIYIILGYKYIYYIIL